MKRKTRNATVNMVLSAMFLALGIVMPFITGQIPEVGSMLLPMHLPVLICGFVCGWKYGLVVGFIVPLLRSVYYRQRWAYENGWTVHYTLSRWKNKKVSSRLWLKDTFGRYDDRRGNY